MKKVLLTGVSGFIGSHTLRHLLKNTDWQIIGVASWKHKGTPERVQLAVQGIEGWQNRVKIITHELVSPFTSQTLKQIEYCDYVVNVAAESHVERSIQYPASFVQNNVNVSLTTLEYARAFKPEKFIQISTDEVYGPAPEGYNHKEWDTISPSNPYSASKACQEAIAFSYWRSYGVPVIITNTMNNFGETQDKEKYLAKIISRIHNQYPIAIHGQKSSLVNHEWLFGSRYYLHARNHADAILWMLNNVQCDKYSEFGAKLLPRFNVVGDTELNNKEVVHLISEIMGKTTQVEYVDYHATRPGHDRRYALDGTKLRKLGWRAPFPFLESLERYVKWTLEHKEWL